MMTVETKPLPTELIDALLANYKMPENLIALNGTEKTEGDLAVAGDQLRAKGVLNVLKCTEGIVLVSLAGKPASEARFEIK